MFGWQCSIPVQKWSIRAVTPALSQTIPPMFSCHIPFHSVASNHIPHPTPSHPKCFMMVAFTLINYSSNYSLPWIIINHTKPYLLYHKLFTLINSYQLFHYYSLLLWIKMNHAINQVASWETLGTSASSRLGAQVRPAGSLPGRSPGMATGTWPALASTRSASNVVSSHQQHSAAMSSHDSGWIFGANHMAMGQYESPNARG